MKDQDAGANDSWSRDQRQIKRAHLHFTATEALNELQKIARAGGGSGRDAALSLVGAAIDACELVRLLAKENPNALQAIAPRMVHWPVVHSLFPGDEEGANEYLAGLSLGADAPIQLQKWRLKARGTKWAYAYWQMWWACREHQRILEEFCRIDPPSEAIRLFNGAKCTRADYFEVLDLPPLADERQTLNLWRQAFGNHVRRHYPGYSVVEHRDWKSLLKQKVRDSDQDWAWAYGKLLGEVKRGFGRIAKRRNPPNQKNG